MTGDVRWGSHPWELCEPRLDPSDLAHTESLFALSNGHLGMRGTLDEGDPHELPGTYLNGLYEELPMPRAEPGYGLPEDVETVVNITNGKLIRLFVDDEPFDVRTGELRSHRRVLDLRAGTLTREVEWRSPGGRAVHVRSVRLVSLTHRSLAAIRWEVEPVDGRTRIAVRSELQANEPVPERADDDPRSSAALGAPLEAEQAEAKGERVTLVHRTRSSGLRVGAAMDHIIDAPDAVATKSEAEGDLGSVTVETTVEPGSRLRIVKLLSYAWSGVRSPASLRQQVRSVLDGARANGWDEIARSQREALDDFWDRADVQLDGDPELQQAVRFGLFQVLQAGAQLEGRGIPAKGLTGRGYDGHVFWDSEVFVLPVLTYTMPGAARAALRWRRDTLPLARARAQELGLEGAAPPWRTIGGQECATYWPAGTAAFHIAADIAASVVRYAQATGDEAFERDTAAALLVETARLWRSLGHHHPHAGFCIDGITGPDEYSALVDNNVYTNLMAQRNLRAAADAVERYPDVAADLDVGVDEVASWRAAADEMAIPYDEALGVHPQAEGFTRLEEWDFDRTDEYPLLLNIHYFELYRRQVVKQPDLVLALHLCGDAFTAEEKARNFDYYERRTVRDSSLSACTQAVVAAELGHLELAHDYWAETALIDLQKARGSSAGGLHLAALAGGWIGAVAGFGGMRDHGGRLSFAPRLPSRLTRLSFRLCVRGSRLTVDIERGDASQAMTATYTVVSGGPVELTHHGSPVQVEHGAPVTLPIPDIEPLGSEPTQPPGRAPLRRS